jgi:chorismate mutase
LEVKNMPVRGVRGATTVAVDEPEAILQATRELLTTILDANPSLRTEDLASGLFTTTEDLHSAYPAQAAREMGWIQVPMICSREIPVPSGLPNCIRVLLQWNTELTQDRIHHIYLGAAKGLRPDLSVTDYS